MPALAQLAAPAPVRESIDGNGVDLFWGTFNVNAPAISMGAGGAQGLSYMQLNRGNGWTDNIIAVLNVSGSVATVTFGGSSDSFSISGSTYTSTEGNGSTLSLSGTVYTYTNADGTVAHFDKTKSGVAPFYATNGRVTDITRPNGQKLTFSYESLYYCSSSKPSPHGDICLTHLYAYRVTGAHNSYGYRVGYAYALDSTYFDPTSVPTNDDLAAWATPYASVISNLANTTVPGESESYAQTTVGTSTYLNVTDNMSRVTKFRTDGLVVYGITKPGSSSEDVTVGYTSGRVTSVVTPVGTTYYSASDSGGSRTVTVTDPGSNVSTYVFNIASQRMTSFTDPNSHTTSYTYDSQGRMTRETEPEGNYTNITYLSSDRNDVTEVRKVAKSGSGLSDIVTTANYDTTCSNAATCNQPHYTIDARGNQTDYAYDATTGLVTSVTAPAPTTGATRPQTRYSYTSYQAYFDPAFGTSYAASGEPVTLLTGVSQCQTGSSCAGTSDEVKTTIGYGAQTSGVGNNLLPVSVSKGAGDASLTATTAIAYDNVGNVTSVDGPLSGSDDTTTYTYDGDRERLTMTSADPDGAGVLKRRAVKTTYNAHGIATETEVGTATGQYAAGFSSLQQVTTTLDAADRKTVDTVTAGGTTYGVTQYSYDSTGRLQCTALRMNSAAWGSLPSSACTLGTTGSDGPDRITKTTYDAASQPTLVQTAYGTAAQANEVASAYNANGTAASVTDANGNKTSYAYDGFDRLWVTYMPSPTSAGTSSSTDYEQLTYDADSNVTVRRLRDGNSIGYTYDALNRVTTKDLPNIASDEYDVSYTYDLLGRLTHAQDYNSHYATLAYDALNRETSEQSNWTTRSWQYDLAGRKTRLTWQDGFYVAYDYDTLGEMTAVRENGASSGIGVLASYGYDDLGRRASLVRGNGTSTSYGYDNVSRLTSFGIDLAGTSYDQSVSFGYNAAGQITSTTRSNDAYAYTAAANRNDSSGINGLNQMTSVGSNSIGYDGRGNINSAAGVTYSYTGENKLATSSTGYTMTYDPLGRYHWIANGGSYTWMQYDGSEIIEELQSGTGAIAKRYVWGASADEPLVEYDASGNRTWLTADERGSIVARTNDSGSVTAINTYDEYGVPGSGNVGRFQYTGQAYIPELGLYYYKARMYSSRLGRFMQTDPIGYGAGMNWYNYAGGDAINGIDPAGTKTKKKKPSGPPATGSLFPSNGDNPFLSCSGNCGDDSSNSSSSTSSSSAAAADTNHDGYISDNEAAAAGITAALTLALSSQPGDIIVTGKLDKISYNSFQDTAHGYYIGDLHNFNGYNLDTNGQGGIGGAMEDFDKLRRKLHGGDPVVLSANPSIPSAMSYPTQYVRSILPSGAPLNLRITGPLTVLSTGITTANARIDIPKGSFSGQLYSITIHYTGVGSYAF